MNTAFHIVSCQPSDALFTEVLPRIYGGNSNAQLHDETDADYLVKCLVVKKSNEVLGRLAVYQNTALTHLQKPVVQLGNFECMNDGEAAKALLDAGLRLAKSLGVAFAIGPMNGSTWNPYRFISDRGDVPLFFTEQEHPDYYPALWQEAGFAPFEEYVSGIAAIPADMQYTPSFFTAQGFSVRDINPENLQEELYALYPLCIAAFVNNPFSSAIGRERFTAKLLPLQPLLGASFTKIVSDASGAPVGFILCLPDVYDKSGQTLIVKTAAKHPACTVRGLMSELYKVIMAEAYSAGYRQIIHAFMHMDNRSLRRSQHFSGKLIRRYSLYIHPC